MGTELSRSIISPASSSLYASHKNAEERSTPTDGSIQYGIDFHLCLGLGKLNLDHKCSMYCLSHNLSLKNTQSSPQPNGNLNSISVVALE